MYTQDTHGTGKMAKKVPCQCQGKHREFGNFVKTQGILSRTGKTQGILLAQVVNVPVLKVKDIAMVAAKKIHFKSVLCM